MSNDRLRSIAEELLIIAGKGGSEGIMLRQADDDTVMHTDPEVLTRLALAVYRDRAARARELPAELLGEPAWDILLDLFINRRRGQRISITSACTASQVPPTTALRWIAMLVELGLVSREEDQTDKRRAFVSLSGQGERTVTRLLHGTMNRMRSALAPYEVREATP